MDEITRLRREAAFLRLALQQAVDYTALRINDKGRLDHTLQCDFFYTDKTVYPELCAFMNGDLDSGD